MYTYVGHIHFPAGIFRQIQIQYTFIVVHVLYSFSGRKYFVQYKYNTRLLLLCYVHYSDQKIPPNTNTIHIYCCCVCVVFTFPAGIFRPIQMQCTFIVVVLYQLSGRNIPSNTNTICLCCNHFPAGIFRLMQIQCTFIAVVFVLYFILLPEYSGRNIPSNTNAMHIGVVFVLHPFLQPEYSVKYKYNTNVLLLYLNCIQIHAGIFR